MKYNFFPLIIFAFCIPFLSVRSQESARLLDKMIREDSAAITALALYPDEVRESILEACLYPEALVRIEALQKNTSESFRKTIESYSKEEQQKIWDLSRYPGLISKIAGGGKRSREELEKIVLDYPEEIRKTAMDYGTGQYDLLVKVNALNTSSEQAFESTIGKYPDSVKTSFRELVKYPEVVNILTSDLKMSVLVGDMYKKQPQLIHQKLDSISTEYAKQNAKDFEAWKNGLEKNPAAKEEMVKVSKEFAREQGYEEEDIAEVNETVVVNYVIHPYPYWYGYPWWYDYPYWYPYPYWYDWGFYHGPYGIVYIGFPSPFFTHWYFHYPHHHYHYHHFTDYCVGYYYGPHRTVNGFHREVSGWVKSKEKTLPKNFFAENPERPDKIKELGKLEMDYDKAVKGSSGKPISRDEFLNSNASSYPHISPVLNEPKPKSIVPAYEKPVYEKSKETPVYQEQARPHPIIITPRPRPPVQPQPKPRPAQPQAVPLPAPKKGQPKGSVGPTGSSVLKDDFGKMIRAQDYHRSNWNHK